MTTNGRILVFLGPSLGRDEAQALLPAIYLPPASQGCIVDACRRFAPTALVIIDGVFDSVPAVRHKEILWALGRGIPVYGCSSMGALRAAELSDYGMIGHGTVYRWYRATPLADDDEVAVLTGPEEIGWRALSDALIDIRRTIRRATAEGIILASRARQLVQAARETHFSRRTYADILARHPDATNNDLADWLRSGGRRSLKADDARSLLRWLATDGGRPVRRLPDARLERHTTIAWMRDLAASGHLPDRTGERGAA